jgi:hypothetical protein
MVKTLKTRRTFQTHLKDIRDHSSAIVRAKLLSQVTYPKRISLKILLITLIMKRIKIVKKYWKK